MINVSMNGIQIFHASLFILELSHNEVCDKKCVMPHVDFALIHLNAMIQG